MNVLIAPDKFKGTLSAHEAAQAIARGWSETRPDDSVTLRPISDGGDGFGELMRESLGAKPQSIQTIDAAHRSCSATWWWNSKTKTAVIESARIIGLAMLPPGRFHPFDLDTFGLGKVLLAAKKRGAKKIILGIGGSATNDGGFGLARALGWKFFDHNNRAINHWTELHKLSALSSPGTFNPGNIIAAVDVQNPLLGIKGATRTYGPQKGLRAEELARAEINLKRLAMTSAVAKRLALLPGSGAAGGLGFGLTFFCGAKLRPGFALFASSAKLRRQIRRADLVITGEGAIDRSTIMGKGVGELALLCREENTPCIGLAGVVRATQTNKKLFKHICTMTDLVSQAEAMNDAAYWLQHLAAFTAKR